MPCFTDDMSWKKYSVNSKLTKWILKDIETDKNALSHSVHNPRRWNGWSVEYTADKVRALVFLIL